MTSEAVWWHWRSFTFCSVRCLSGLCWLLGYVNPFFFERYNNWGFVTQNDIIGRRLLMVISLIQVLEHSNGGWPPLKGRRLVWSWWIIDPSPFHWKLIPSQTPSFRYFCKVTKPWLLWPLAVSFLATPASPNLSDPVSPISAAPHFDQSKDNHFILTAHFQSRFTFLPPLVMRPLVYFYL